MKIHDAIKSANPQSRKQLFMAVRASFVARGSSLARWATEVGLNRQDVRKALLAEWRGPGADALIDRVIAAASIDESTALRQLEG